VLVLVLVFAVLACAEPPETQYQKQFAKWIAQHKKSYGHDAMFQKYNVFRDNLVKVLDHNERAAKGEFSFTLEMNHLADLSTEEFRQLNRGLRRHREPKLASSYYTERPTTTLPTEIDWRGKGLVADPKDQGACGSCWAFSAVAGMEGAHAMKTGTLIPLSEQELVDCVNGGLDTCDTGGQMTDAFAYAIQSGGMESEKDYPYLAKSGNTCKYDKSKSVAQFKTYMNVTSFNETDLQVAVASTPTVSVGIDASSFWFQLYGGGVFDLPTCKNKLEELDHGVAVVGYGTDAASGKDYWIVKNSWGPVWGSKGYILMSRNKDNQCGIATDASYPIAL